MVVKMPNLCDINIHLQEEKVKEKKEHVPVRNIAGKTVGRVPANLGNI